MARSEGFPLVHKVNAALWERYFGETLFPNILILLLLMGPPKTEFSRSLFAVMQKKAAR